MNIAESSPIVAVIGGTGREGRGLAYRWARAGYSIILGSRAADRAAAAALELEQEFGLGGRLSGATNLEAAERASIVMLTVPYLAHASILESIKPALVGKLLIDATVPLQPGKPTRVQLPTAGSAAAEARAILGGTTEVAAAFHTVSHDHLMKDEPISGDVLVTGTSAEARAKTLELVAAAGLRGWDSGPLDNTVVSEGLTSILIHINRKYGSRHAGIRIAGVDHRA